MENQHTCMRTGMKTLAENGDLRGQRALIVGFEPPDTKTWVIPKKGLDRVFEILIEDEAVLVSIDARY